MEIVKDSQIFLEPVIAEIMEECCVCLDTIIDRKITSCGHLMCKSCTFKIMYDPCPLCRKFPVEGGHYFKNIISYEEYEENIKKDMQNFFDNATLNLRENRTTVYLLLINFYQKQKLHCFFVKNSEFKTVVINKAKRYFDVINIKDFPVLKKNCDILVDTLEKL